MPRKPGRPNLDRDAGEGRAPVLTVRVPDALRQAVTAEAERRGMTVSVSVRQALAIWLAATTEAA